MTISLISSWANEELVRLYNVIQFSLNEKKTPDYLQAKHGFPTCSPPGAWTYTSKGQP